MKSAMLAGVLAAGLMLTGVAPAAFAAKAGNGGNAAKKTCSYQACVDKCAARGPSGGGGSAMAKCAKACGKKGCS